MNNLTTRSIAEMTKSERDYLRNELNEVDKNDIRKELEDLKNAQKKSDEKIGLMEAEQEKTKAEVKKLKKNTNVICSPFHSKRKRNFNNLCKSRVWNLFNNDKDSCEYVLFNAFLFKKIYGDIATHFDLDTWHDLSMENYEKENSLYSQAKDYANYWTPSNWYIKSCIAGMIEKRDKGILSPERCRALTEYLRVTNNGEINPFSA